MLITNKEIEPELLKEFNQDELSEELAKLKQ